MSYQLFSTAGCMRCSIVKSYMHRHNIPYEEQDIKADGKEIFKLFYRENRSRINRGLDGIEFPILSTGEWIFQGVGVVLAHLMAGNFLDGFVTRSDLCHGWVSGLNIFAGPMSDVSQFITLLKFLKDQGMMIQLEADGRNPMLLEKILNEKLIHSLIFYLRGPAELYESLTGTALSPEELSHSLSLLNPSVEYKIILPIAPIARKNGSSDWLGPEDAAKAAEFVETTTRSKKHPFFIKASTLPEKIYIPTLQSSDLFKYRTLCRRYMVLCDILKS